MKGVIISDRLSTMDEIDVEGRHGVTRQVSVRVFPATPPNPTYEIINRLLRALSARGAIRLWEIP